MKGNIVASELFIKLQTYWINKFSNIEYRKPAKKDKNKDKVGVNKIIKVYLNMFFYINIPKEQLLILMTTQNTV